MDNRSWQYAVDDEGDDDEIKQDKWRGHDYLIFMIDCSQSMLKTKMEGEEGEEASTCFQNCLKAVTSMYKLRCVTGDKDYLGVLLYNTNASKNSHNFEHVYVFQELGLPDANQVKQLESFLTEDGKEKFMDELGHGEAKLDETFWMAGTMFSAQGAKQGTKRIILLTNCDKPHKNDPDMQKRVIQKVKDLADQNIGIDVLPVGGDNFDWSAFYQIALDKSAAECAEIAADRYDELQHRTASKSYKRRATANLFFQLGPGVEFGVGLYNMYAIARIPTAKTLDRKTNEPVASARTFMDAETGEKILQVDMKKYQTYGGKKIAFDKDEVDQLKTNIAKEGDDSGLGLPATTTGFVLLGFKPQSYLKPYHYVQPGLFVYPEDKLVQGSSKLFRALLEKCAARRVMAICRLVARGNMAPRLVALLPQPEELDEKGVQSTPSGFNVVYLPYADDIRDLQKVTEQRVPVKPSVEQIETAKALIRKLKTDNFGPELFPNPALQKHYRAVEAIALDRESVEQMVDVTEPNIEWMEKKGSQEMDDFVNSVFSENHDASGSSGSKRKGTAAGGFASKKAKVDGVDLETEAKEHRLESITVPVLRELCKQKNITLKGTKKADIIKQIYNRLGLQ